MKDNLYEMIFKRKSFHLFRNIGNEIITNDEIEDIEKRFNELKPLVDGIKVKIKIVKEGVSCRRGQEYCILFYCIIYLFNYTNTFYIFHVISINFCIYFVYI